MKKARITETKTIEILKGNDSFDDLMPAKYSSKNAGNAIMQLSA